MSVATHTPGAWSVLEHEGEVFVLANGAMQIAQVTYVIEHAGEQGSRRLQNARVMATAPELLAELRTTTMFLHSACLIVTDPEARRLAIDQVTKARAVIARAEGSAA